MSAQARVEALQQQTAELVQRTAALLKSATEQQAAIAARFSQGSGSASDSSARADPVPAPPDVVPATPVIVPATPVVPAVSAPVSAKLYTFANNSRSARILVAARYANVNLEIVSVSRGAPEVAAVSPFGKVPTLVTQTGNAIFSVNAIAVYLAELSGALQTQSALDAALVQQYAALADLELYPAVAAWVFPTQGLLPYNEAASAKAQEDLKLILTSLNIVLASVTFLAGDRLSLADITVATTLLPAYQHVFSPAFRQPYAHVNRWFDTVVNQPEFKAVLGDVVLATAEAPAVASK
eukprot:m.217584 g.217584  ORF g.217584 m.217584 type:complete len:296 (-) comp54112_c0_seq4:128-1015(-)